MMASGSRKKSRLSLLAAWLLVSVGGRSEAITVHVDAGATGTNDGSSWDDAFTRLTDALQVAGSVEIWVAEGRYTPAGPGGSRSASFALRSGQALYGGFRGTETSRGQRDPAAHPTVLSGDLNGNDLPGSLGGSDNSSHVVTTSGADATLVLDGFTIEHGYASAASGAASQGGGLLLVNSSPLITDCRLVDNFAHLGGAAVVAGGSPLFSGCVFRGNRVQNGRGGGIYNASGTTLIVSDCVFEDNSVRGGAGVNDGGAIFNDLNASLTVARSVFAGNTALSTSLSIAATGGGITHLGNSLEVVHTVFRGHTANVGGAVWCGRDALFANCVFTGNTAVIGEGRLDVGGVGGAIMDFSGVVILAGCTLSANSSDDGGGTFIAQNGELVLRNSILWGNRDSTGTTLQGQFKGPGTDDVRYSCVQNLLTPVPGEDPPDPADFPGSIDADPLFVDAEGADGTAGTEDDNLRLAPGSPAIDAGDNAAVTAGVTEDLDADIRFRNDPDTPDTGSGAPPIVDMGAYEFGGAPVVTASLSINSDNAYTASTAVTLTLAVTGAEVTKMRLRNGGSPWGPWEAVAADREWTLEAVDGVQTVHGEFGDDVGTVLAIASDSIVVDTTAPSGSVVINGGAEVTTSLSVTLDLAASDDGIGVSGMRLSDGDASWSAWEPLVAIKPWTLPGGEGLKSVHVQFRDGLGNISPTYSDEITYEESAITDFIRGDADKQPTQESSLPDAADSDAILRYLEDRKPRNIGHFDAADVNDDGRLTVEDYVMLRRYLDHGGREPSAPFPTAGSDPTPDSIRHDAAEPAPPGVPDPDYRLTLYRVSAPDDPEGAVLRLHLSYPEDVAAVPELVHAAVEFDAAVLQLNTVQPLLDPRWSVISVNFSDLVGPTGQVGISLFCNACFPDPAPIPEGDVAEIRFDVVAPPAGGVRAELVSSVGLGNLAYYTGVGVYAPLPGEAEVVPMFVEGLFEAGSRFVRGDANADKRVDISDAIFSLLALFQGAAQPPCLDSADSNDDGKHDVSDPVRTLSWIFRGGPAPPPPQGAIPLACGLDPTADGLSCDAYLPCYE